MLDISEGIQQFNNCRFFEAHDFFESMWNNASSEDRLFFQGLVQIAVGSYHLANNNRKGTISQFNKGLEKLKKYRPEYYKINISSLIYSINTILHIIENIPKGDRINEDIRFPQLEYTNEISNK